MPDNKNFWRATGDLLSRISQTKETFLTKL